MESKLSLGLPGLSLGLPGLSLGLPCTFRGSPKLHEAPRGPESILTTHRMILWEPRTRSEQDRKAIQHSNFVLLFQGTLLVKEIKR